MNELMFYRCECGGPVSVWNIQQHHGCPKCGGNKLRPTNLTFVEKIAQVLKHPKVWRWGDAEYFRMG